MNKKNSLHLEVSMFHFIIVNQIGSFLFLTHTHTHKHIDNQIVTKIWIIFTTKNDRISFQKAKYTLRRTPTQTNIELYYEFYLQV